MICYPENDLVTAHLLKSGADIAFLSSVRRSAHPALNDPANPWRRDA